jgi:hypothetical protein
MRYNGTTNDMEILGKNVTGDTAAHLRIDRDTGNAVFAGTGGDAAVQLPADSINPTELLAEPGIASVIPSNAPVITMSDATPVTFVSRTITAPAPGIVVAIASCRLNQEANEGVAFVHYAIGMTSSFNPQTSTGVARAFSKLLPSLLDSDSEHGVVQGVFSVPAGASTFTFRGLSNNDGAGRETTASTFCMTLMYFPTSYGTADVHAP